MEQTELKNMWECADTYLRHLFKTSACPHTVPSALPSRGQHTPGLGECLGQPHTGSEQQSLKTSRQATESRRRPGQPSRAGLSPGTGPGHPSRPGRAGPRCSPPPRAARSAPPPLPASLQPPSSLVGPPGCGGCTGPEGTGGSSVAAPGLGREGGGGIA